VGKRESHDSSSFYARFTSPELTPGGDIAANEILDRIYLGDARDMSAVHSDSVALVVTSPPYFVGKEYEEALGEGHVPATYLDYLQLLEDVFAECVRVLEPGGRIAVNVANLGRRPYRSLSSDVISILQDRLRLLLRGEVIWQKGVGASGSCAWGSFQSPQNPVLRDITERIVIASKGRFDRAQSRKQRHQKGLPSEASIFKDEFMEATLDVWDIPPESATRVNHPAPFPVELPKRLIELYTYREDVVLDPFSGSGSTAVAAVRTGRHFLGFETDESYRALSVARLEREQAERETAVGDAFALPVMKEGGRATEIALDILEHCGFKDVDRGPRFGHGVDVDFTALDASGRPWFFDVVGGFTTSRSGLRRMDVLWRALGKAAVLRLVMSDPVPFVLLSTDLPQPGSPGDRILQNAKGSLFQDALEMLSSDGQQQLAQYASGSHT
jgi:site-specific DNA-methyltransferase (adenine-specific)